MELTSALPGNLELHVAAALLLSCAISLGDSRSNGGRQGNNRLLGTTPPTVGQPQFSLLEYVHRHSNHGNPSLSNQRRRTKPLSNPPGNAMRLNNVGEIVLNDFVYGKDGVEVFPWHQKVLTAKTYFSPIGKYKDKLKLQQLSPRQLLKKRLRKIKVRQKDKAKKDSADVGKMEEVKTRKDTTTDELKLNETESEGKVAGNSEKDVVIATKNVTEEPKKPAIGRNDTKKSVDEVMSDLGKNKSTEVRNETEKAETTETRNVTKQPEKKLESAYLNEVTKSNQSDVRILGANQNKSRDSNAFPVPVPLSRLPPYIQQLYWLVLQQREADRKLQELKRNRTTRQEVRMSEKPEDPESETGNLGKGLETTTSATVPEKPVYISQQEQLIRFECFLTSWTQFFCAKEHLKTINTEVQTVDPKYLFPYSTRPIFFAQLFIM